MAKNRKPRDPLADANVAMLGAFMERIEGCSALLGSAEKDIHEKIKRILDKEDLDQAIPDKDENDYQDRISLAGSAKLERAAQDLEATADSIRGLIRDIRQTAL